MPLPAHPNPGFGPPASTHSTPSVPLNTISSRVMSPFFSDMTFRTVGILLFAV